MTSVGKGRRVGLLPVAAALLAVIGAVLLLAPQRTSQSAGASSTLAQAPNSSSAVPTSASGPQVPGEGAEASPHVGDEGEEDHEHAGEHGQTYPPGQEPWRPVVTGFATDFTQPGPDWSARVTRWTSDYLTAEYSQLDPIRVPVAALLDIEVRVAGESIVDVVADYDTGLQLLIRVEDSATGWKVTRLQPAAQDQGDDQR